MRTWANLAAEHPFECIHCGSSSCDHGKEKATGWCYGMGQHDQCPGRATGHEDGSCPCACHHPEVAEDKLNEVVASLRKLRASTNI